jgi:colanic acid biosynthesis glycosyl transferase WcaI
MKVLVITQYFWPENFRINELVSYYNNDPSLEFTILTGAPNYPQGKIYAAYKDQPGDYINFNKNVEIIRIPIIPRGQSAIQLILNYLSHIFSASLFGLWKLRKHSYDHIFIFEPSPIFIGLPAIVLKKYFKCSMSIWVLDIWPESLVALKKIKENGVIYKLVLKITKAIYSECNIIFASSREFVKHIQSVTNKKEGIYFLPNWVEEQAPDPNFSSLQLLPDDQNFKYLFAGNVGEAQGFPELIKAFKIAIDLNNNIHLYIVGDGRYLETAKTLVADLDLQSYIFFIGWQLPSAIPYFLATADALILSLKANPIYEITIPGKLPNYMMASKPILAVLGKEGSKIIEEAQCGFVSAPGNVQELASNIQHMSTLSDAEKSMLGKNARNYAKTNFSKEPLLADFKNKLLTLT